MQVKYLEVLTVFFTFITLMFDHVIGNGCYLQRDGQVYQGGGPGAKVEGWKYCT